MTDTIEATEETTVDADGNETGDKARDFTRFRENHKELADFINSHPEFVASGLAALEPGQIKAVLALRADFNKLPEQVAKREERKREIEAEKAKFAGLSPEQIKAMKAADRAEKQAQKMREKAEEAMRRAEELKAAASGSAADLAAAVEAKTNGSAPEAEAEPEAVEEVADEKPRRLGRRRS
ncbi:gp68 [Mycobacterium phage Konstantine]|uniref:Uncharacterized protein n=1 Tax=Mycobacterium phage Konstantine TaxID=563121 RepID=B5U538_9CAUD|nr:gp68 [Mycobacterium phage Konstantine]ACI12484.1 hypothetical protein KONSTANTINE_68 [Mycobacterium phage Konstantine]